MLWHELIGTPSINNDRDHTVEDVFRCTLFALYFLLLLAIPYLVFLFPIPVTLDFINWRFKNVDSP